MRPGWTTPAEYLLVRAGLASAAARSQALASDVAELVSAANLVGKPGGVVIIDG